MCCCCWGILGGGSSRGRGGWGRASEIPVADVAAVEYSFKGNVGEGVVGFSDGVGEGWGGGIGGDDAAAGCEESRLG